MGIVTLRWVESTLMVGTDSNVHSLVIGRSPEENAGFIGLKPSDLLLLAVASCSAYDVVEILRKQKEPLRKMTITCRGEQQNDPPYKFTEIHIHYLAEGKVDQQKLERAIQLSEDKYCSVIASLRPGVPIESDYEIRSPQEETK
jgi:putative redox protein